MSERRLRRAVGAWMVGWLLLAGAWAGAIVAPADAGASRPALDCAVTAPAPHQIPGPQVEFDGVLNQCAQRHTLSVSAVGLKDGVVWTVRDARVCPNSYACSDAKSKIKAWGCHDYQVRVFASVDGQSFPSTDSPTWRGCR